MSSASHTAQITLVYNKANEFGLKQDAELLQKVLKGKIRVCDPLEPAVPCDLVIHLEIPYAEWLPFGRQNVLVVNPEWYLEAWNPLLTQFTALIFKCEEDRNTFLHARSIQTPSFSLPWTTQLGALDFKDFPKSTNPEDGFLWLLGASKHKREAAVRILPQWKAEWPSLTVYTTTALETESLPSNVILKIQDLPPQTRKQLQAFYPFHLIFSEKEALAMVAHEGLVAGAFLVGNPLPTYREAFSGNPNVVLEDDLATAVETALRAYSPSESRKAQQRVAIEKGLKFHTAMQEVLEKLKELQHLELEKGLPAFLPDQDCPPISIITLLHNRRRFVDLAFHNLLITDYPKDKIEWVVVEDSDLPEEQSADKILKFGREAAPLSVSYIPMEKKNVPIGAMRNMGVKRAQNPVILFMDDDDHYPPTSFRRRVAWLTKHPWKPQAAVCTTIACYDLLKGTSAVNTPPWSLPLSQRVSEATLTFTKQFWEEKKFPKVSMGEGEGFLEGREGSVVVMPPQQIIVAMSHGKNASSRRIPPGPSGKPSCFWGFPHEFLKFIHKLADIEIEELESVDASGNSARR